MLKIQLFWDVMLWQRIRSSQLSEASQCPHHQGQADGGNVILQISGTFYPSANPNIPEALNLHQHFCENLKSQTCVTYTKFAI